MRGCVDSVNMEPAVYTRCKKTGNRGKLGQGVNVSGAGAGLVAGLRCGHVCWLDRTNNRYGDRLPPSGIC